MRNYKIKGHDDGRVSIVDEFGGSIVDIVTTTRGDGTYYQTPVFDEATANEILDAIELANAVHRFTRIKLTPAPWDTRVTA